MFRNALIFLFMLLASCTSSSDQKQTVALSVDVSTLNFDAEGGQDTFTATTSEQLLVIRGDGWITVRKGVSGKDNKTSVSVTAERNTSAEPRQTWISVEAGGEKVFVEVNQAGSGNSEGDSGQYPVASKYVALSFDDGPNNHTTAQVLDILEEYGVPASFFVIGQHINDQTAQQMTRAISLGCEIQNHSYTHSYMTQLSVDQFMDELERTDDLVEKYTSTRPTMFRPPYIDHNASMHEAVGHTFINGVGCQDWDASVSAQARYNDLMGKVKDGDIILLHDFYGNDNTVEALKMIIPELKKRGYAMVTVSELFEIKGVTPQSHSGYLYSNVLQKGQYW